MVAANRHYAIAVEPSTDPGGGNVYTPVFNTALYGVVEYLVFWGDSAADYAVTLEACPDYTPSASQPVPFAYQRVSNVEEHSTSQIVSSAGFSTVPGNSQLYVVMADPTYFPNDWTLCRLHVLKVGSGNVTGTIMVRFSEPRYAQQQTPSVVTPIMPILLSRVEHRARLLDFVRLREFEIAKAKAVIARLDQEADEPV